MSDEGSLYSPKWALLLYVEEPELLLDQRFVEKQDQVELLAWRSRTLLPLDRNGLNRTVNSEWYNQTWTTAAESEGKFSALSIYHNK